MHFPEAYDGGGLDLLDTVLLAEQFCRKDATFGSALMLAGHGSECLLRHGSNELKDKFIPQVVTGEWLSSIAWQEKQQNKGLKNISTTAIKDSDEWVINGSKCWPGSGGMAAMYLTICTTDPNLGEEGIAIIYVPAETPGLSFGRPEPKMGFRSIQNASVYYDNVRVPKAYRLAGPGDDAKFFKAACSHTKIHSSAMAIGISRGAFDTVLKYTENRMGGGKPVRQHTIVAGILADMAIQLEASRALVYNMTWMLNHPEIYGPPFSLEMISKCNIAKVFTADAAVLITNKGMELMGANGYSPEYHLEKYLRDAKALQLWLAGQQVSRYDIARGYYDLSTV